MTGCWVLGGAAAPFLFFFTDGSGVTRQFFFQKERFSHEIQVLKARIAAAQHQDVQEPTRPTASPRARTAASSKVPPLPLLLLGIVLLGIGLYLARQIAAGQGGYIRVKSAPGQGSVFSLYLPRRGKEE